MYELIPVGARTYYIDGPTKLGVYRHGERDVCLIDSGSDGGAARRVLRLLAEQGWRLTAILNTHSHADHVGGNALLQQETGCPAYASRIEAPFIRDPVLEPTVLFGAFPYRELRNKFLQAAPSRCEILTPDALPAGVDVLPLPGHAAGMAGFHTADDVWFVADAVLSAEALEKYRVTYLYDVASYLASLDRLETLRGRLFVPSHAAPAADLRPLIAQNRASVQGVLDWVAEYCRAPRTAEQLIQATFSHYGLRVIHNQYATVGATLRACLSYLHEDGRLRAFFSDFLLLWQTAAEP